MTCRHAASGCNYPEGDCADLCNPAHIVRPELTKAQAQAHAVLRAVKLAYEGGLATTIPLGDLAHAYTELARAGATLE